MGEDAEYFEKKQNNKKPPKRSPPGGGRAGQGANSEKNRTKRGKCKVTEQKRKNQFGKLRMVGEQEKRLFTGGMAAGELTLKCARNGQG